MRHPLATVVPLVAVAFAGAAGCAILSALDDDPVVRHRAERPGQLHAVAADASDTRPARLLVFVLTDEGKPVVEPAH